MFGSINNLKKVKTKNASTESKVANLILNSRINFILAESAKIVFEVTIIFFIHEYFFIQ